MKYEMKYLCDRCKENLNRNSLSVCKKCKEFMFKELIPCACGCGEKINRWKYKRKNFFLREYKYKNGHRHRYHQFDGKHQCPVCNTRMNQIRDLYRHIDLNRCQNKPVMEEFKKNWNKTCHCGCGLKIKPGRKGLGGHTEKQPWNKGLTKEDDKRLLEASKRRVKEMRDEPSKSGKWMQNTSIERKVKRFIEKLNIKFYHQYSFFYKYVADFAIPNFKLLIECDGDYWHNYPDGTKKDKAMNKFVKQKGWKILRLWENDIKNNFKWCKKQIRLAVSL